MIGFRSFNLLDYCCKEELHEGLHTPLTLWSVIEAQISKKWYLRWACHVMLLLTLHLPLACHVTLTLHLPLICHVRWSGALVFKLRKMMLKVTSNPKGLIRSFKLWCLGTPAASLTSFLQKMNQIAMEASVELWMGLTDSDHIQWLGG